MERPTNGKEEPGTDLLKTAMEAARVGGDVLLTHLHRVKNYEIEEKAEFDFATEVDHAAERAIVEFIHSRFPDHRILAEEGGEIRGDGIYRWIIDPLDGTTNYIHGVRVFAVSIAVMRAEELVAGVVFDPIRGETFTAARGEGAYLNGSQIGVSQRADLHECLLATGFPFRAKSQVEPYLRSFRGFFSKSRDIRRMGAAALDLAYVAAGRFDGFWELNLHRWDIAAGVLLIQEAGGAVSGFRADENFWESGNIVASNGAIHDQMLAELAVDFPEQMN